MHNLTKIKIFRILLLLTYPISLVLLYPFVLFSSSRREKLYFFFDRFAIGGAQRVHLDILASVADTPKRVYFTRHSPNDKLKNEFYTVPNTTSKDIHFWCDNLLLRLFTVHYFAFLLNRSGKCVILGGNSTFFYDMLPFISHRVFTIELLHNFSYGSKGMEFFGLANRKYLDRRMVIDSVTRNNILMQYQQAGVQEDFEKRVKVIEFGVTLPSVVNKPRVPPLRIMYAGRGTHQKRIWLLNRVAEAFINREEVQFIFAGSMADELSPAVVKRYKVYHEVSDRREMDSLYEQSHVIILTSAFEGFPVAVKEGMAYGCVPIVPALPGIMTHLVDLENALVMSNPENEDQLVSQAIQHIEMLLSHHELLDELSARASSYAATNFGKGTFLKEYRDLLLNPYPTR